MADKQFELVVIGGGPGGYAAAIRAAQLKMSVMLIDDRQSDEGTPAPGGTCLNVGCVPSKALLDSSKHFHHIQHEYKDHGIRVKDVEMDIEQMLNRKQGVVKQLNSGLIQLFKANKITFANGTGRLLADRQVEVTTDEGTQTVTGEHVILAAGSVPFTIPGVDIDNTHIVDNEGALAFSETPKKLGVIGAGVIGLELGSVWRRLGAEVTLFEAADAFFGGFVCQHWAANQIANRPHLGRACLALVVDIDLAAVGQGHTAVVGQQVLARRATPHRNQQAIKGGLVVFVAVRVADFDFRAADFGA